MERLKQAFLNPPAAHRPAPLWVWNDLMREEQIARQLIELKSHGFGGAFVHPRPGLITDYLSDEWFRLWGFALQTAKDLGLKLYIYDENSYPSGFAGGHVASQLPDCLATGITYTVLEDVRKLNDEALVKAFSCTRKGETLTIIKDLTLYPASEWAEHGDQFFVISQVKPRTTGWLAGFAYVDLLRPEVTECFLKTTYEAYYEHYGNDFGDSIPAIFTDEPYVSSSGVYGEGDPSLPFSYWLANEFDKLQGYSLLSHLPCLFKNVEGAGFCCPAEKVRYDYYSTIHKLWTENFVRPVSDWCEKHNIAFTGHYLEHQWPFAYASNTSPALQSHYEYHQWPAIDMLLSNYLRDTESHALTISIQEIRSAANQFKKERTLCELYGAGGWDSTFEDYKRMGDWILVNGINFINQHLTYSTIAGARKRDHPQSFDWREPWWQEYTQMNDYLGRASYMLSQGVMQQRILILNPSTTGFLIPFEEEDGSLFTNSETDAIRHPDMHHFLETLQQLANHQWDFDLGDEHTLQRHGKVENGRLRVGEQAYEIVIVSGDMKNMFQSTASLLDQLMTSGGCVMACGEPGSYIDGLQDELAYQVMRDRWETAASADLLIGKLQSRLSQRLTSTSPWATGVTHMRRVLDDGREIYFFVNHNRNAFSTTLTLKGTCMSRWNLFTGLVEPIAFEAGDGHLSFELSLERNQSAMLIIGTESDEISKQPVTPAKEAALVLTTVDSDTLNMLPVSYCHLYSKGQTYNDIYVLRAADLIYTERGFDGNPWDNKVQFRNNLMNRNHFGQGSGFIAEYPFYVSDRFKPSSLFAVAEHPDLCRIQINGHAVDWLKDRHYLDHHFGMADISEWIVPGENAVSVIVDQFDVRMELESLYITGDFSVETTDGKWVLNVQKPMQLGSMRDQGRPFYAGAVEYRFETVLEEGFETALLDVSQYNAAAVSCTVNGQTAGLIGADGARPLEIASLLKAGQNEIVIRLSSTLKNLLGPHFMKAPVRGSAWPAMWKEAPGFHQPLPETYDLLDFGLTKMPGLTIG